MRASALESLNTCLRALGNVAVAVSGGVDSMTLSFIAHRALGTRARMYHAISPAVPVDATERVRAYAQREGWALSVFDAGEFDDQRYRTNPVDRCYHCKRNLYEAISRHTKTPIASGTNLDDLGDYRPGLRAAEQYRVRHPYVEVGLDKQGVRELARLLELERLAELPAAPCLSSRMETGIAIEADVLGAVYAAEQLIQKALAPRVVRCRLRRAAVVIELDPDTLHRVRPEQRKALADEITRLFQRAEIQHPVEFGPYRMGSAFLRNETTRPSAHG